MATTTRGFRYPVLSDTANVPRDVGYLAADVEAYAAKTRHYTRSFTQTPGTVASGTVLGTLTIPAQTLACRVKLRIPYAAQSPSSPPGFMGLVITTSAGTLAVNGKDVSVAPTANYSVGGFYGATLDLAASTAATITVTTTSSGAANWWVDLEADIWFAGEYA